MIKTFPFRLDIEKEYNNRMYSVNSNDLKTVKFTFVITDNGIPLDLTGLTVRIAIRKPDKKAVWQDCTVTNAPKGEVEVILESQAYIKKGEHEAELMLYKGTDTVAITQKFHYRAEEGIMSDKSLKSETVLGPIDQKLAEVEETLKDIRDNGTGIDAKARQDIQSVTTQLAETAKRGLKDTTKDELFSGTNEILTTSLGGEERFLNGTPANVRKKVLFIGSSVCKGYGATNFNGWVNRLRTILESRGWATKNMGIHGNATWQVIDRFYKDVVPERPDVVVIALNLSNDGLLGHPFPDNVYKDFTANMKKIIFMCKQQGYVPIVTGPYPQSEMTEIEYKITRQWAEELESWNIPTFNFLGAMDDGQGHYIPEAKKDDLDHFHPNDAGYESMFRAVPPSIFDNLLNWNDGIKQTESGSIYMEEDFSTTAPMVYIPPDPIHSFTIFFRTRATVHGLTGKALFEISKSAQRVRNPGGVYEYVGQNGVITSTIDGTKDLQWHDICVTHNHLNNKTRFYVDGIQIGTETIETLTLTSFCLGGREINGAETNNAGKFEFKDLLIYRTCMLNEQILSLHNGRYLKGSLELFCPMSDNAPEKGTRLLNLAPTNSFLLVNSPMLTQIKSSVSVSDIVARNVQFPGGGRLYVEMGKLMYMKPDGTTSTLVM